MQENENNRNNIWPENERFRKQIEFIVEIDKLKQVYRQTYLMDKSRKENDAEHSWHFALIVVLLAEYADKQIDILKVVKMALIHDLVEIDAGDTFVYNTDGYKDKAQREQSAADRIFALLPEDQATHFRGLWDEFEERKTPEAKFAASIDRLQPLLHNYFTQGKAWKEHGIAVDQVIDRNKHIKEASESIWDYAEKFINDSAEKGYVKKK